jgi:hypothetical protein
VAGDERLAAGARRRLAGLPAAAVVVADFETWRPARAAFDAVVAFTAFETYSGHRAPAEDARASLLKRVHERVEGRPGGRVRKTYLATLDVAERVK